MPAEPSAGFQISWIARMLRTRFDARARATGLTRSQWSMIVTIRLHKGGTQSEIASRMEINTVTAGRIVDRLEATGWVARRPDPVDRRVNRLYLTDHAAPVLAQLQQLGHEEDEVTLAGFSTEERRLINHLLKRVVDNLVAAPTPSLPPMEETAPDVLCQDAPADHQREPTA